MEQKWYTPILAERNRFYRLAFSYVKNEQDAMDVVQDAFCKAWKQAGQLRSQEAVMAWFYRIVINTSLNHIKKKSRLVYLSDEAWEQFPDQEQSESLSLRQLVDALPSDYKTVIILRYFEDMKIADIAEILDANVNTVKTRLYTALKKLRVKIDCEEDNFYG